MWQGVSPVPVQMWAGEPSPGADVGGASPVPAQMWARTELREFEFEPRDHRVLLRASAARARADLARRRLSAAHVPHAACCADHAWQPTVWTRSEARAGLASADTANRAAQSRCRCGCGVE
jgi:hypothetical protein